MTDKKIINISSDNAPKIEFPCEYPIKVMGTAGNELHEIVKNVMHTHVSDFDELALSIRDSKQGNYQSITVTITATGKTQLQAIFNDLKKYSCVKMVL